MKNKLPRLTNFQKARRAAGIMQNQNQNSVLPEAKDARLFVLTRETFEKSDDGFYWRILQAYIAQDTAEIGNLVEMQLNTMLFETAAAEGLI